MDGVKVGEFPSVAMLRSLFGCDMISMSGMWEMISMLLLMGLRGWKEVLLVLWMGLDTELRIVFIVKRLLRFCFMVDVLVRLDGLLEIIVWTIF